MLQLRPNQPKKISTLKKEERHCEQSEKVIRRMEKIFANHMSDRGLIAKIYKEPFNNKNF